jgi:phosphomannomutase
MTKEFKEFFEKWALKNTFYLVTGSDLPKLQEQMDGLEIHSSGIFTCCGNQFWESDPVVNPKHCDLIYENKFELPQHLDTFLKIALKNSDYPFKYGNHIEDRGSMVNFSIIGRNCTMEQRKHYFDFDNEYKERKKIADIINKTAKGVEASIGGQISIDIYEEGKDKSQVIDVIKEKENADKYIFIGDRTKPGGNDYPLAYKMWEMDDCDSYQTDSIENTIKLLKEQESPENNFKTKFTQNPLKLPNLKRINK